MASGEQQIAVDGEGFLRDYRQWTPAAAEQLADAHNITLEQDHWRVLRAARAYYDRYQRSPDMRPLVKWVRSTSKQELGNSIALMQLFPGRTARLVSKLAGLPKPPNCL